MDRLGIAVVLLMAIFASAAYADSVLIGLLSFDAVIPGMPGSSGVNRSAVANLMGNPALDAFALPRDFPVRLRSGVRKMGSYEN
jgi:hypothetical protein